MDIKYFEQAWCKREVDTSARQEFWDSRAEEFNQRVYKGEGEKRRKKIFSLLASKGMLSKDADVLDIGCGPGKYAVEFAKKAKSVTGIDFSPKMIKYAEENKGEAGLFNIHFKVYDWEKLDLQSVGWDKKFDLVFAAMSPAINSRTALEKMVRASRGACFLSHFVERRDEVKDFLDKYIAGDTKARYGKAIYCSFNILWLMGLYPEITYIDTSWEQVMTIDQAKKFYFSHFELTQTLTFEQKEFIQSYLAQISEDGLVKETVNAKIALMTWKVKKETGES